LILLASDSGPVWSLELQPIASRLQLSSDGLQNPTLDSGLRTWFRSFRLLPLTQPQSTWLQNPAPDSGLRTWFRSFSRLLPLTQKSTW